MWLTLQCQPKDSLNHETTTKSLSHEDASKRKESLRLYSDEELYSMEETSYKLMDYKNSINLLREILSRDSLQAKACFRLGRSYSALVEYDSANFFYMRAAQLNYKAASCYYNIGLNYLGVSDSLAIEYFQKAVLIDPSHSKAQHHLKILKSFSQGNKQSV